MHIILNLALILILGMGAYDYFGEEYRSEIFAAVFILFVAAIVEYIEE